jgi:hypothetical protein
MGWASNLPISGIVLAAIAGPAVAGPGATPPTRELSLASTPAWAVAPGEFGRFGKAGVRMAVTDNIDLFMKGGKDKPLGESVGRRASGLVGQPPKAVKLGVLIRW